MSIKVSVIIPFWNSRKFLGQALSSVLDQNYENIEIIAIDDGSSDESKKIVSKFPCVKYYYQENAGACRARNLGLQVATGEYVKFLDSDDIFINDIIKKQVSLMNELDSRTIVYSDWLISSDFDKNNAKKFSVDDRHKDQIIGMVKKNLQTSSVMHRRELLMEVGGFNETLNKAQEYDLHIRLAMNGVKFKRIPVLGAHIRDHNADHRISNVDHEKKFPGQGLLLLSLRINMLKKHYAKSLPYDLKIYFLKRYFRFLASNFKKGQYSASGQCCIQIIKLMFY